MTTFFDFVQNRNKSRQIAVKIMINIRQTFQPKNYNLIKKYDQFVDFNWHLPEHHVGQCRLDPVRINNYLGHFQGHDRIFIETLLSKTLYITYSDFLTNLHKSFQQFLTDINNQSYYILIPRYKIGSEYWLIMLLWKCIRRSNFVDFVYDDQTVANNGNIIIIDDAIYSGVTITGMVEKFISANSGGKFYLIIPYASILGATEVYSFIHTSGNPVKIYTQQTLPCIATSINLPAIYGRDYEQIISERFLIDNSNLVLAYFDHKMAVAESVPRSIYMDGVLAIDYTDKETDALTKIQKLLGRYKDYQSTGSLLLRLPSRQMIEKLERLLRSIN